MPSIAQIPMSSSTTGSPAGSKKRRREQISYGGGEYHTSLSGLPYTSPTVPSCALFITSSTNNSNASPSSPAPRLVLKPRLQKSSRFHDAKRQRISSHESENRTSRAIEGEASSTALAPPYLPPYNNAIPVSNSDGREIYIKIDLSPCHICHQKPKVRIDLDSYGYCEGCQKRTCYICMRECLGPSAISNLSLDVNLVGGGDLESHVVTDDRMSFIPQTLDDDSAKSHISEESLVYDGGVIQTQETELVGGPRGEMPAWGHKGMICSQCCVERGAAGEVRCFGCLRVEKSG